MKVILINSPSRKGQSGMTLPLGLLYVGKIILNCGHEAKIIDPYLDDVSLQNFEVGDFSSIAAVIEDYQPEIVGFGGIASSYGRTKQMSLFLKKNYPGIFQIAGGALSSVYQILLNNTNIDLVFHGETETSLPLFLQYFGITDNYKQIPGVSYADGLKITRNRAAEQIKGLDSLALPAYHLIQLEPYLQNIDEWAQHYQRNIKDNGNYKLAKQIKEATYYLPIVTSRGCTHRCLFCYRHVVGHRQHSVAYVINHINYLKNNYGIKGFSFVDELFNANEEWVEEFCNALENNDLEIFYLIGGARINNISARMLRRLKETGCIEINYGQESGSDIILKELHKGVTRQQNLEITKLTTKMGLNCPVQLVIGTPKETSETINDTIKFLKEVEADNFSLNYLIPLPETPIWKIVEERRLIADMEAYLNLVAEVGGNEPLINLTAKPNKEWRRWGTLIKGQMMLYKYQKTKNRSYLYNYLLSLGLSVILYFIPKTILKRIYPRRLFRLSTLLLQPKNGSLTRL